MKILRLSLISLMMSGCLVLCLFGPQQAETIKVNRCQVVNTIMEHNSPVLSDCNCIFKIRDILNSTLVGGEEDSGFRYSSIEPKLFQVPCDTKCEDLPDQIDLVTITCSNPTVRFAPPRFGR